MTHLEIKELLLKLQVHMEMKAPLANEDEELLAKITKASLFPILYRGIGKGGSTKSNVHVTSWTIDKSVAEDFSHYHDSCEKRGTVKVVERSNLYGYYLPLVLSQLWETIVDPDFCGDPKELIPIMDILFKLERNEDEVIVFTKKQEDY